MREKFWTLALLGPQITGELRTRTERLFKFHNVGEGEKTLDRLMQRDDGPVVATHFPVNRESAGPGLCSCSARAPEMQGLLCAQRQYPDAGHME